MNETTDTTATEPAGTSKGKSRITQLIGKFALGGALLVLLIGIGSLILARYGLIDKITGFRGFMYMMWPMIALFVVAVVGIVMGLLRKRGAGWRSPVALVLSVVTLGVIYTQVIAPARAHPPLHDISTDLEEPPEFRQLTLREDNLVPFNNMEEWRSAHREGYPDIQPVVIDRSPEAVLANARTLAEERGWEIVNVDPAQGVLEATATAGFIRFFDDVVVEVTPVADGSTRVDMRSVSRVGVSDLGYNAERVSSFLADLRNM
ncbi:DUF1499 domain-containing protein [Aurantiacibacter aquimixticola]|uniref:DUF1499 domain-containing protein n=1 Tax=Aurantiacibacter aquimixticola TaxID=1958945 RepID=UPI0014026481|nr:DUF1499 domain-containing protein [Aurantiacibacter aquimixticola]